eukprot:s1196_g9.t2
MLELLRMPSRSVVGGSSQVCETLQAPKVARSFASGHPAHGVEMWPSGKLRRGEEAVPTVDLVAALEAPSSSWSDLGARAEELRPEVTLVPGQSFGWKQVSEEAWLGVLGNSAVLVAQRPDATHFQTLAGPPVSVKELRSYFGLEIPAPPLPALLTSWGARCARMARIARCLAGLRVLQQDRPAPVQSRKRNAAEDPEETSRICLLTDRLRARFGEVVCRLQPLPEEWQGEDSRHSHMREFGVRRSLHAWPRSAVLAKATERSLKDLGLGYRAAYISQAARRLMEEDGRMLRWLQSLRADSASPVDASAPEESEAVKERRLAVRRELCELPGIGAKVADCVALFGLGVHGAVPVVEHSRESDETHYYVHDLQL